MLFEMCIKWKKCDLENLHVFWPGPGNNLLINHGLPLWQWPQELAEDRDTQSWVSVSLYHVPSKQ